VITAGGTLGILIPPSVMIIVYAAVAGQSVVKLYASAMLPGFFLAFLYLVYVVGWALINPKIAPKLPDDQTRVPVPEWARKFAAAYSPNMFLALGKALVSPGVATKIEADGVRVSYWLLVKNMVAALVPILLTVGTLYLAWWYVVIHQQADTSVAPAAIHETAPGVSAGDMVELGGGQGAAAPAPKTAGGLEQLGSPELLQGPATPAELGPPEGFYLWFTIISVLCALALAWYYWKLDADQFEILKLLTSSTMPLGILTVVVLAVILFGITTATESAAVGAAGAYLLAIQARTLTWQRVKESVFLTAKTTAMVCWLFVGSALFSAVFAILGGQSLVEQWVLSLNMSPLQFMLLSQAIIFVLGWPLEWTEIIVIFVPIFLPLLKHFNIDPILWGTIVFVNLQAAFLSPPVAMSAFYLKGVSPPHVTLNQIFAGMMPYMIIVCICMVIMYLWPGMSLWLPNYLYGGG
jgi:TRAP-type mannitol/chloroaromatic compound transport system permease large subunit